MSQADLNAVAPQLAALTTDQVASPTLPVSVFCAQGELMRAAATRDHDRLVTAGVGDTVFQDFGVQLSALATAEAEWQVYRLQGRPQGQIELEDSAFERRTEAIAAVQWGLREVPDAISRLAHVRDGQGLADTLADLDELAALLRVHADQVAIPGYDARAEAARCEEKAAEVRTGAAQWKLDQSQAVLLDRRNRAFTLAATTAATIRSAAQYAFRNQDERRVSPYRDHYTAERRRRYRRDAGRREAHAHDRERARSHGLDARGVLRGTGETQMVLGAHGHGGVVAGVGERALAGTAASDHHQHCGQRQVARAVAAPARHRSRLHDQHRPRHVVPDELGHAGDAPRH